MTGQADGTDWMTVGQAAEILGVGAATVRRWTASARLKAFITPEEHRRYKRADITEFAGTARYTGTPNATLAEDMEKARVNRRRLRADPALRTRGEGAHQRGRLRG